MNTDMDELLQSILEGIDRIDYVKPKDIPNIDLYMDQVTTLMESKLRGSVRYPKEDKILTKTMINNYAKDDLLPPPIKKKYTKEHVLLLIFIYYYKGFLSINDIRTLFGPITERFFGEGARISLEDIYKEVSLLEISQVQLLKEDVTRAYKQAATSFDYAADKDKEYLQLFALICQLSFDVYVKKMLVEKLIDEIMIKYPTDAKAKERVARMEKEAKEKAEKEAKEAKEMAEKEAKEARERGEREAKELAARMAKEKAMREKTKTMNKTESVI